MIAVRAATAADADVVCRLAQEVHALHAAALPHVFQPAHVAPLTAADVARLAATPGQVLLVASTGGAVVGYAHAEVQEAPATAYKRAVAVLHVHAMAVATAARRGGAGRALLRALREAAAERALSGLSLDVYAFNAAARAFYAREGFVPFRERLVTPATARPL